MLDSIYHMTLNHFLVLIFSLFMQHCYEYHSIITLLNI